MAENMTAQEAVRNAAGEEDNALSTRIARKADNLKYVFLGAVAVLAAAVGIFLYAGNSRAKQQAAAADAVFRSFVGLQGKTPAEAAPVLVATAKEYAGQPAGIQAAVHAFGVSMDAKQYAEAERIGNDFLKNYPESALIPRFKVAIAQAMVQQNKTQAAIDALRAFVGTATPETLPEGKLALAQALEKFAFEAKDNADEHRARLEAAEAEYADITSRARLDSPVQRGFWPQMITLTADYALVQIRDGLAGHVLTEPAAAPVVAPVLDAAVTEAELEAVRSLRPPAAAEEAPEAPAAEAEE